MYELKYNKSISVLSGNHHKNIVVNVDKLEHCITNHGSYDYKQKTYINQTFLLPIDVKNKIFKFLHENNINSLIQDRDTSICIHKLNESSREGMFQMLTKSFPNLRVLKTGKTSIELLKLHTSKFNGYCHITNKTNDIPLYIADTNDIPELTENKLIIRSMEWLYILLKTFEQSRHYLNDMIIVAGGTNNRMNNIPKLLMDIRGQTLLDYITNVSQKYINNIYILTNTLYYDLYDKNNNKYNVILCKGLSTDIPNGNLETIHSGLEQIKDKCSDQVILMWSDCIPNENIVSEMSFIQSPFLIPCRFEADPYAYLVLKDNTISRIAFKKNEPINYGLHDMSIFSIDTSLLLHIYQLYFDKEQKEEKHLFDIIPYIPAEYWSTEFATQSFNTPEEYRNVLNNIRS
jgi:choline kinase